MADNVAITAGSGTTVAADELTDGTLGSVKVQFMKIMDGTLDSSNKAIVDSSGRLSVLGYMRGMPLVTSTATLSTTASPPTTVTSNTAGIVVDASAAGNITVLLAGTFTGNPVVVFEISDASGTVWYPWQGVRADVNQMGTQVTLSAGAIQAWEFAMPGPYLFRVRLTTATGSGSVAVGVITGSLLYDPVPASQPTSAGTAALTNVTAAAASTSLLAANNNRKGVVMFNDSTANLFVAFAGSASTTAFTYKVAPGGTLEIFSSIYTGAIFGIWSAANGAVRITELT